MAMTSIVGIDDPEHNVQLVTENHQLWISDIFYFQESPVENQSLLILMMYGNSFHQFLGQLEIIIKDPENTET